MEFFFFVFEKDFFFHVYYLLTFGLRSSSLGPAAATVVEVESAGALLALAASLFLCFSRRLSSLQIKIHRSAQNPFYFIFQNEI